MLFLSSLSELPATEFVYQVSRIGFEKFDAGYQTGYVLFLMSCSMVMFCFEMVSSMQVRKWNMVSF